MYCMVEKTVSQVNREKQDESTQDHDPNAIISTQLEFEWRSFHSEKLCRLYLSPNDVRVIKFRKLRQSEHVDIMGEGRSSLVILTGKSTVNLYLLDLGAQTGRKYQKEP